MGYGKLACYGALTAATALPLTAQAAGIKFGGNLQAELVSVSGDGFAGVEGPNVTDALRRDGYYGGNQTWVGVKGKQALGDGYKAIARFRLKPRPGLWGFNKTSGTFNDKAGGDNKDSLFSGRDAFAGLATPYGTVTAGTMTSPYKKATVKWDPFKGTFMQARGQGGMSRAHNSYLPNQIAYANQIAGIAFKVAAILDNTDQDDPGESDGDHGYSAMAILPAGPVEVALAYQDLGEQFEEGGVASSAVRSPDNEAVSYKAALRYKPGAWTLVAQYEHTDHYAVNYGQKGDFLFGSAKYKFNDRHQVAANLGYFSDDGDDDIEHDGQYAAGAYEFHFKKEGGVTAKWYIGFTFSGMDDDEDNDPDTDDNLDGVGDYFVAGTGTRIKF